MQSLDDVHIIACGVFRPALKYLRLLERYPELRVIFLPSNLHLRPQELKNQLGLKINTLRHTTRRLICLYGECFPDISGFCAQHGVCKIQGYSCHEFFLGLERYRRFIDEITGTYFLEQELIKNFEGYCVKPLELNDPLMRDCFFKHYQRVIYIRQPSDPELGVQAGKVADFLGLSLEIVNADYLDLEERLVHLIEAC
ncbi:MAG: DUF1638 domain-containing protein [Thermodesulfobacteriota bacterium]|nr:DUF1638 domain-containing protein [Thermodesulfobacteriota bacterium]